MARPKKGYYQGKDDRWIVVVADAVREDGSLYTFKRMGIETDKEAEKIYLAHFINQRRNRIKIDHRALEIPLVTLKEGLMIALTAPDVKASVKASLPSRIKTVSLFLGDDYYLNFLESYEEKEWLKEFLCKNIVNRNKFKNAIKGINQLTNCLKLAGVFPETIQVISGKKCEQKELYNNNCTTIRNYIKPTIEEKMELNTYLLKRIFNPKSYFEKSLAAAYYLCINVKEFKWAYTSYYLVRNWDNPYLILPCSATGNYSIKSIDLETEGLILDELIQGKDPFGKIFSKDQYGKISIDYNLKNHFRKTLTYKLFGKNFCISAFKNMCEVRYGT